MKILVISDLHTCDNRFSRDYEQTRLRRLAEVIRSCGAGMVLNLGDTVSRKELLRPDIACEADGYRKYMQWRSQFDIPFVECAVAREFSFFAEIVGQEPDSFREVDEYMSIITIAPQEAFDHRLTGEQLSFLTECISGCRTPNLLIASHVPYPGSCSREIEPGIFLEIPENLRKLVEESERKVLWGGGHFHWPPEPVRQFGSLTAFYGGRFASSGKAGYLRMIDSVTAQVEMLLPAFEW